MKGAIPLSTGVLLLGLCFASGASAQAETPEPASQTLSAIAEIRSLSDGRGTTTSLTVEDKYKNGDTTAVAAVSAAQRDSSGSDDEALALRGTLYEDWTPKFSTRTSLSVAEDTPIFAHIDVAQDFTFEIADATALTAGVRWAEYFGDRDVTFASIGVRRYFGRGSIAYRLTDLRGEGQDDFFAHLINLRLNDRSGGGNMQLWLSSGETLSSFDDNFAARNRAFTLQRTQPLSAALNLIASAGYAEYRSAAGDYSAATLRIGLSSVLD